MASEAPEWVYSSGARTQEGLNSVQAHTGVVSRPCRKENEEKKTRQG